MKKYQLLLFVICHFMLTPVMAKTILVSTASELVQADKQAKPGDVIILKNGYWENIRIQLNAIGTEKQPIYYQAETPGKLIITGNSSLSIGGAYLIVDGFLFQNGQAGNNAIISFRSSKEKVANHCQLTNSVIDDFNNEKRMSENYWVELYGKHNRVDHCKFQNKKNMGVLMAVILDDERSRENYHSIDHNVFGLRIPLASNSGEIIRVGVSQHCEFNSYTQITENYFEHCDGETEIISIKSASNLVSKNLFFECQGSIVLRHGNNNTVSNNVFLGNNKLGTGGVRIINEGQWVLNNYFYQCRGEGFRAPLCVMNGVPNSPAFRYLPVANALVANNSFIDCAPMGFCEGSDTERSQAPVNVLVLNNLIVNKNDPAIYHNYDNITGFHFSGNLAAVNSKQSLIKGFQKIKFQKNNSSSFSIDPSYYPIEKQTIDSIQKANLNRTKLTINEKPGFSNSDLLNTVKSLSVAGTGVSWFSQKSKNKKLTKINCINADEFYLALEKNKGTNLQLILTGSDYSFSKPVLIQSHLTIISNLKTAIKINTTNEMSFLFQLMSGSTLALQNLNLNLSTMKATSFISTDSSGSSNHLNLVINNCKFDNSNETFFYAAKSSVADSIIIKNSRFNNGKGILFKMNAETDKKGYYNVEQMKIAHNSFNDFTGQVLVIKRTGNDESTMGPLIHINNNSFNNISVTNNSVPIFQFDGIQYTNLHDNSFISCNKNGKLIAYTDEVKAIHYSKNNQLSSSGEILNNKFVIMSKPLENRK